MDTRVQDIRVQPWVQGYRTCGYNHGYKGKRHKGTGPKGTTMSTRHHLGCGYKHGYKTSVRIGVQPWVQDISKDKGTTMGIRVQDTRVHAIRVQLWVHGYKT